MASCPDCEGAGKQQCPKCAGSGAATCETCGGTGTGPHPGFFSEPWSPGAPPPPASSDAPAAPPAPGAAAGATPAADPDAIQPIKLRDFQVPDGSAQGKVPDEDGWMTGGSNGALECFNPHRGELHLGIMCIVCLPGGPSASMASMFGLMVAPYMQAQTAVTHVWPQFRNLVEPGIGYGYVQIGSAEPMNWGAGSDAGVFQIRYQRGGIQWHGNILASTVPLPNDDRWVFHYSQLAVPETDDGSVYQALTECWKAYTVSKAQPQPQPAAAPPPQQPVQQNAAAIPPLETSKLHDQLLQSRQATSDTHHAAMLELLKG